MDKGSQKVTLSIYTSLKELRHFNKERWGIRQKVKGFKLCTGNGRQVIPVKCSEGNKGSGVVALLKREGLTLHGFIVEGPGDIKDLSVECASVDDTKGNVYADVDVGAVCPGQLPLIIETSSMAKSPV